ncbi:MAG: hypothetical protein ACLR78_07205 [Roseburia sp.]
MTYDGEIRLKAVVDKAESLIWKRTWAKLRKKQAMQRKRCRI